MAVETVAKVWSHSHAARALDVERMTISDLVRNHRDEIETVPVPTRGNAKGVNSDGMAKLAALLNKPWPPAEAKPRPERRRATQTA